MTYPDIMIRTAPGPGSSYWYHENKVMKTLYREVMRTGKKRGMPLSLKVWLTSSHLAPDWQIKSPSASADHGKYSILGACRDRLNSPLICKILSMADISKHILPADIYGNGQVDNDCVLNIRCATPEKWPSKLVAPL